MLKTLAATVVALFLVGTMTQAQPSTAADAVKAADAARFKAQTTNDFTALGQLLADDLVYTHSSAAVDGKASFIESMRSGTVKYESIESRDVQVRVYGTTAIINGAGRFRVTARGEKLDNQLRYTDVWVLKDGRWQMVSWQSTKIP